VLHYIKYIDYLLRKEVSDKDIHTKRSEPVCSHSLDAKKMVQPMIVIMKKQKY